VPSNLIMHRTGARVWIARIMVTWGLVSAAMMFAHDQTTFYVLRFLLGVAEAGFFPGVILYLTYWFPAAHRAQAMGFFYFGAPLAFIFGSPLSGLLLELDGIGGWHGWQWPWRWGLAGRSRPAGRLVAPAPAPAAPAAAPAAGLVQRRGVAPAGGLAHGAPAQHAAVCPRRAVF